jgi:hypothetical protein
METPAAPRKRKTALGFCPSDSVGMKFFDRSFKLTLSANAVPIEFETYYYYYLHQLLPTMMPVKY